MKFDEQYIKTLERVFDLTKAGRTEEIVNDFSIPKMFGAWSSIFWALPHLDKFGGLQLDELKKLVKALIKSHVSYKATTNQFLRTETLNWIIGALKIKANVYGIDENEGFYVEWWVNRLYDDPETEYSYSSEIGKKLRKDKEIKTEIEEKEQKEKAQRLDKIELENEIKRENKQAEKRRNYFKYLEQNQNQKDKREEYLSEFSKLSEVEKIRAIITDERPLFFFPTDISDVDLSTLSELTSNERDLLVKKIQKYRMKEWNETKERIEKIK